MDLVVWVDGADERVGRAVALHVAAAGVRVLVTGRDERAVGACVGEIAFGGGRARHFVGGAEDDAGVAACLAACAERFGRVDAVLTARDRTERVARALAPGMRVLAFDRDAVDEGVAARDTARALVG